MTLVLGIKVLVAVGREVGDATEVIVAPMTNGAATEKLTKHVKNQDL
jgi:hypothetical protein